MAARYETGIESAQNSAADALARAEAAGMTAGEARELALGRAGYREVGMYEVNFAFDSDELSPEANSMLDRAAADTQEHPGALVDIYGYTDPMGTDRYNFELGERRAQAVLRHLLRAYPGQLSRFAVVSLGKTEALSASTPEERARARKVVVSIVERTPLTQRDETAAVEMR